MLSGSLEVTVGSRTTVIGVGDTMVLPGGTPRQVTASGAIRAIVAGHGAGRVQVPGEDHRGTPPQVA